MPFQPSILKSLFRQRRELRDATEFAEIPVTDSLAKLISELKDGTLEASSRSVWSEALYAGKPFLLRHIRNNFVFILMFVLSIIVTRELLKHTDSIYSIIFLASAYLLADVVRRSTNYLEVNNRSELSRAIQLTLLRRVCYKLTRLDPSSVGDTISKGNLKTLLSSDIESVEDFVTAATQSLSPTIFLIIALTPLIWILTGWAGLAAVFVSMLQIPISFTVALLIEYIVTKAQSKLDSVTTLLGEWIRNIRLVRYLGWQGAFSKDITKKIKSYARLTALRKVAICFTFGISYSWWMFSIIAMLWVKKVYNLPISTVDLFASIWTLTLLMNWIQFIPRAIGLLGSAQSGVKRLEEFLALPELVPGISAKETKKPLGAPLQIHFKNISLINNAKTLLKDLTLSLNLKDHIAIVGSVGSGKSLLLDLVLGEREPSSGTIEIEFENGYIGALWEIDIYNAYRNNLAWSAQTPFLSNATVRENLTLMSLSTEEKVEDAAKRAELLPDIKEWPEGFEQVVGEIGINLSGGQKQRVSLARAFHSERPIWILDDPLSAVDRRTEIRLAKSLFEASRGVIIASHRLDEIMRCHRVLVLEKGEIIEDGAPDALMMIEKGSFRAFVEAKSND